MTPAQARVLEAVGRLTEARGFPPTVRELCADLGTASPSTVWAHLGNLRRSGHLTWEYGSRRTLRVVERVFSVSVD